MADTERYWNPGKDITCHASAALTGGRAVAISGARTNDNPTVGVAGAGLRIFGVAARDAASGAKVLVYRGGVVEGEAGANVAAGDYVEVDASGRFITLAAGVAVGQALDAITSGNRGPVALLNIA